MQCFCNYHKELGDSPSKAYTNSKGEQYTFCSNYYRDNMISKILGQSVSIVIILVNLILKTIIIKGITWVGEDTNSVQLSSITNGVFVAQFFNTGILLLLINGNLTEHEPKILTRYIQGPYYDYQPQWYVDVGYKIIYTMMIQSVLPYFSVVTAFLPPFLLRTWDRKFSSDHYTTRKTSLAQYRDLYSGGEYVIHFKMAAILNVVYLCCMYGVGMPILFPIAAFSFINTYISERIVVSYFMRQPPALDDKLTKNIIEMIRFAPLLMLFNGYWMLSNPQIFENKYTIIETTEQKMRSQHFFELDIDTATPVVLMCFAAVFLLIIRKILGDKLMKLGFTMQAKELEVDEDLPDFYTTVKLLHSSEILSEEANMFKNYGFSFNDGDTIAALQRSCVPKRPIVGTPWYQILSNPKYSNEFMYLGAFVNDRHLLIEDGAADQVDENGVMSQEQIRQRCEQSDLVMILLNLAYIPDKVILALTDFNFGWSVKFKEEMDKYYSQEQFNIWQSVREECMQLAEEHVEGHRERYLSRIKDVVKQGDKELMRIKVEAALETKRENKFKELFNCRLEEDYLEFVAKQEKFDKQLEVWKKEHHHELELWMKERGKSFDCHDKH